MDSNDIIENLWHEAVTIRAAVARAYEAVGGEGLPASLVQALNYITEHAGGGEACGASSTCVPNSELEQLYNTVFSDAPPSPETIVSTVTTELATTVTDNITSAVTKLWQNPPDATVSALSTNVESAANFARSAARTQAARFVDEPERNTAGEAIEDIKDGLDQFILDADLWSGQVNDLTEPIPRPSHLYDVGKWMAEVSFVSDFTLMSRVRAGGLKTFPATSDSIGQILDAQFS